MIQVTTINQHYRGSLVFLEKRSDHLILVTSSGFHYFFSHLTRCIFWYHRFLV